MKPRIRFILLIVLISSFTRYVLSQESSEEKFHRGNEFYSAGDYEKALAQWDELFKTGYRSSNLYYNMGNAYFKLNNVPGSILFYERALLLKPADEDVNYNLQIARTLVVDRFEEIPKLFFVKWFDFLSLLLPSNNWAKISITTFILCLLLLSLYFYTSVFRFKVLGFWLAILFFVVSLLSISSAVRNKSLVFDNRTGVIFSPQVNGKSSPDDSGTDLFVLHEGTKVSIEDEVGEWFEIRLSDGNKGWIPANSMQII